MNRQQMISRLQSMKGLDVAVADAGDLLNQGQDDFALRSQYPRKLVSLDSVAGVAAYEWPADFLLARSIALDGSRPFDASDRDTVRQYEQGAGSLVAPGVWFDGVDATGGRKLMLYPTPGVDGSIELEYVYRPGALVGEGDEPSWMPAPFHKGLLYSAAAVYFEEVEDDVELAKWNQEKADAVASELRGYDIERASGNGVFQVPVSGWTLPR